MGSHAWTRRSVLHAGLGACVALPALPAGDPAAFDLPAVVDSTMAPLMAAHDLPGMAVGISLRGRQHFFHYGVASRQSGAPVTGATLFEIGSLSKPFTATLATYAQAAGALSLDDRPSRYLPDLRGSAIDQASLLHLGTYTAGGLPLQFPDDVASLAQAWSYYRQWTPAARPGEQRRYSNPSIGLCGHLAALALGGDFAELCEHRFFRALGLRDTFIRVPAARAGDYAWGYNRANQAIRVNPGVFDAQAYGVKTTAADMLRFIEANLQPDTLEPTMRRAVQGTQVGYFQVGELVQGLGWEQYPYPVALTRLQAGNSAAMALQPHPAAALQPPRPAHGHTLFNKTGSTNGFGAYAAFVPARQIGIVMLANRNFPIPARVAAAHAVLARLGGAA